MSKAKVIDLAGGISPWNISRAYAKYLADEVGQGELFVDVCSMGGDVNEALGIKKLFADRGDVTVRYYGFNASASTILGHGAAKTQIYEDAFYLVHKPSLWVDEWGRMNEDEIQQAITNLQAQKKDAEMITLVIANDYVKNRGIDMKTVMDIMQEARWLTAHEAVDLGLIDEVIPSANRKTEVSNQMVAMMKANGLPELPSNSSDDEESKENRIVTKISNEIKNIFKPSKNNLPMNKTMLFVNQILAVDGVEEKDGKVTLTVDQLLAFNNKIKADADSITSITAERDNAVTEKGTAENALTAFTAKIDGIDATVKAAADADAKVAAINAKLASRPAVAAAAPQGGNGGEAITDTVDQETIDNLPHNKAADRELT